MKTKNPAFICPSAPAGIPDMISDVPEAAIGLREEDDVWPYFQRARWIFFARSPQPVPVCLWESAAPGGTSASTWLEGELAEEGLDVYLKENEASVAVRI